MKTRVVVRDERTGRYLGRDGVWVVEFAAAKGFQTLGSAGEQARRVEDGSVVLKYDNPPRELALNPVYCL